MKAVFINPKTNLLRAGWRISLTLILFITLNLLLGELTREINGSLKGGGTLWFTVLAISATISAYIGRKYLDKKSMSSLGLQLNRRAIQDILFGIVNSALVMAVVFVIMLNFNLIEFEGFSWWSDNLTSATFSFTLIPVFLAVILRFMIVAWWEELFFRGIILQNIIEGLNLKWAIAISTLLFALIHAGNPNATLLSTIMIVLITLQLVYAYLKTKQLWMPMGLHFGWNLFQASIFGFASSGHKSPTLISQNPVGPDWLSGGEFGAEGSIILIPILIGSIALINIYINWSNKSEDNKNILTFNMNPKHS
ncbi:CPBP family intramembrane glutamic endopeptidase [Aegicerativicinus sediminis]